MTRRRTALDEATPLLNGAAARRRSQLRLKRAFDLLFAGVALMILSPIWLLSAAAILVSDGSPLLFRQERVGRGGRTFTMLKFRTMQVNNDDRLVREMNRLELSGELSSANTSDGVFKLEDDPRVSGIGKVLRRYSLDELPQLLNVIRGEMSIVGPRPSLPWEVELFEPRFHRRHEVKPGLTGLWQVSGRSRLSMPEMLGLDLRYVDTWSLGGDIRILFRTPSAVLRGDGAR